MTESRHSTLGIHTRPAAGRGVHRLRLLKRSRRVALTGAALLGLAAVGVMTQRAAAARVLADTTHAQALRQVSVVSPLAAVAGAALRLPGSLQGLAETPIYARSSGFVAAWYKDIGDVVKAGEVLARLDTPEVAQQLREAEAAHAQALANLKLATSSTARWEGLRKLDAVSQQEADERRNTFALAQASEASTAATVTRLKQQLDYNRIVAPFAGVITKRNIDVGNLVDAGGAAKQLFVLTRSDPLRVYVQVPQSYAAQVKVGDEAGITLAELPGRSFAGRIARSAGAIDLVTRSLQVEIRLPNPQGELLPGAYVQVAIKAQAGAATGAWRVPGNTLLFRPEGPRVAVVDAAGKVHLQAVTIRRELGVEVELSSGVGGSDRIIVSPADALADGDQVEVAAPVAKKDGPKTGS